MARKKKKNYLKTQTKNTITEQDLENIHPDLNLKFSSSTINSGLMTVHHNDTGKFIDDP